MSGGSTWCNEDMTVAHNKDRATVTYDKNGKPLSIGDFFVDATGHVYRLNGMSAVPNPGVFAAYGYEVTAATPEQAAQWAEQHPPAGIVADSIIWGS